MNVIFAVLAAFGEAMCAALAGTLQHTTARRGRTATWTATGEVGRFARHQLGQPLWWASLLVQAGSLVLHATALHLGSLALVQPVLAIVVVLALPLNHHVRGTRITRVELFWAALVAAGLAGFLVVMGPRSGSAPISLLRLAEPGILAALAVTICVVLARRGSPPVAAVALGTAAGIAFSVEAALLQTMTGPLLHHPAAAFTTPGPYALVASGGAGVTLTQLAYRAGPMSSALPAIVTVNPVVSVAIGSLTGGHGIPTSPGAITAMIVALDCLVVAVGALARITEREDGDTHRSASPPRDHQPPEEVTT